PAAGAAAAGPVPPLPTRRAAELGRPGVRRRRLRRQARAGPGAGRPDPGGAAPRRAGVQRLGDLRQPRHRPVGDDGDEERRGPPADADRAAPAARTEPAAGPGPVPAAVAAAGVGARLPGRLAPGGRVCPAAARQGRGRAVVPDADPYRARCRLPAGPASVTQEHQGGSRRWSAARKGVWARLRLTSLRLRLVLVFALVALTAAVSASGIAYWLNREAVLTRTQDA